MSQVLPEYDIGSPIECKLWKPSRNDTYFVKTADNRYILRIYQVQSRSLSDIHYELDLLNHLDRKNIPVSVPIVRSDGSFISLLPASEGVRYAVLFTYAQGNSGSYPLEETYSFTYGRALAEIHSSLDEFASRHKRFQLHLDYLLDTPLRTILPLLENRPDDAASLLRLVDMLKTSLTSLPITELEYGVCHGDSHGGNAHISKDQKVTFFDFDDCGQGWRAYDIATFRWNVAINKQDNKIWHAFLQGYIQRRPIHEMDLAAVPLFVVIRDIWIAGQQTSNADHWGFEWVDDQYFDSELSFLKKLVAELGL
jgi:Ser/Thr protein kinase RdoA (MazF antagonist)